MGYAAECCDICRRASVNADSVGASFIDAMVCIILSVDMEGFDDVLLFPWALATAAANAWNPLLFLAPALTGGGPPTTSPPSLPYK